MKYRIKIVEYKSGLIEYYPQYKSGLFSNWAYFKEYIYKPLYKPLFGYTNHDSYRIEVKVCRDTLDKAKEFLRNLYPKISYDYNWNQW